MNRDSHLIFEAYKCVINEAPISADLPSPEEFKTRYTNPKLAGQGKKYGHGRLETIRGEKAIEEFGHELCQKILTKFFTKQPHKVVNRKTGEKEYQYLYKGRNIESEFDTLQRDVAGILNAEYGIDNTNAGFTARIILNDLLGVAKEGQVLASDAEQAVEDGLETAEDKKPGILSSTEGDSQTAKPAAEPAAGDRLTVRIEQLLADAVPHGGKLIKYVIDEVVQEIRNSGGLGIPEGKEEAKVKTVLKDLIDKQILKKKGAEGAEAVYLGDNFEAFEASGSNTSLMSDEDLITNVTGEGERPMRSTSFWDTQD